MVLLKKKKTGFLLILISHVYQSKAGESPFEHGKKLPVVPFMVLDNFGMQMCLKECEAFSLCYSINFLRKLMKCELNSVGENESFSLISDQDYVYSEILHPVREFYCILLIYRVITSLLSFLFVLVFFFFFFLVAFSFDIIGDLHRQRNTCSNIYPVLHLFKK